MTDEVIKKVPNLLENPVVIMKSKTDDSRITLFGEIYDANGKPVLAVVELNPTSYHGVYVDEIKLAALMERIRRKRCSTPAGFYIWTPIKKGPVNGCFVIGSTCR